MCGGEEDVQEENKLAENGDLEKRVGSVKTKGFFYFVLRRKGLL